MTPERCMTTCLARGFTIAGVEWAEEYVLLPISRRCRLPGYLLTTILLPVCAYAHALPTCRCYCGNSFTGGGGAPAWTCDRKCVGDDSETCGGEYVLNAYQYTTAPADSCNTTTPTPVASGASSALAAASSGFTSIRASASAGASGSPSASASAAIPSASATAPGVTTEWEYQGCYWDNPADNNGLHLLQGTALTGQSKMFVALLPGLADAFTLYLIRS
jgi:hypothetical protein